MEVESSGDSGPKDLGNMSELFNSAFDLYNEINKTKEPTNSVEVQSDVKKTMNMFEEVTKLVSMVDMFSDNESFEEISTENIKFFLLPALLGTLATKLCNVDREHVVNITEIYFVDFLRRLKNYGLTDIEVPQMKPVDQETEQLTAVEHTKSDAELITELVNRRHTKIQRFKEQKELESKLEVLRKNMDNENIDEEFKRDYFVTLLKSYVNQALEELSSIAMEKPILAHMKQHKHTEHAATQNLKQSNFPVSKLQPIIITKNEAQKKVYGLGYPSRPVMTVEEFYEKRVADGDWPDPSKRNMVNSQCLQGTGSGNAADGTGTEQDDIDEEKKIEADDEEYLNRQRAKDEYKDTHKRGWGNRYNRS